MNEVSSDIPPILYLDRVLSLNREIAAGGMCSTAVLEVVNAVQNSIEAFNHKVVDPVTVYDNHKLAYDMDSQLYRVATIVGAGRYLAATSAGEDGAKEQSIFYIQRNDDESFEGFKLWDLKEIPHESADEDLSEDCSYAHFIPASDLEQWDYSLVVSKKDELAPPSVADSINVPYLTNKDILDLLRQTIGADAKHAGFIESLAKKIKLDELIAQYIPTVAASLQFEISSGEVDNHTSKAFLDHLAWAALRVEPGGTDESLNYSYRKSDTTVTFISRPHEQRYDVTGEFENLGSKKRSSIIGSIGCADISKDPVATTPDGVEIHRLAKGVLDKLSVPEIVKADDELTARIEKIFEEEKTSKDFKLEKFSARITSAIGDFRKENKLWTASVDIGELDISALGAGEFFTGEKLIVATIHANEKQKIFTELTGSLYGCAVYGAAEAFSYEGSYNVGEASVINCSAVDCKSAFVGNSRASTQTIWSANGAPEKTKDRIQNPSNFAGRFKDCAAQNVEVAFVDALLASGCLAEGGGAAFTNCFTVTDSIAKFYDSAFINKQDKVFYFKDNTAEYCGDSFNSLKNSEKNTSGNTIRYPSGLNDRLFVTTDRGMVLSIASLRYRKHGNKLTGNVLGAIKARRVKKAIRNSR